MTEINHLPFRPLVNTLRSARDHVAANNGEFNCQSIKRERSFLAVLRRSITKSLEFPAARLQSCISSISRHYSKRELRMQSARRYPYAIDKHPSMLLVNAEDDGNDEKSSGKILLFRDRTCAAASVGSGTSVHGDLSQLRGRTYLLNAVETSRLYVILFPFSLPALCRLSAEHQAVPSRHFLSYSSASPSRPIPASFSFLSCLRCSRVISNFPL